MGGDSNYTHRLTLHTHILCMVQLILPNVQILQCMLWVEILGKNNGHT